MNKRDLKNFTKNIQIKLIFLTLSSISLKKYVFFLSPYAWLESYGCHRSLGTNISGSLNFIPVLCVLSSHNTLNVIHSDTASYIDTVFHCFKVEKEEENSWIQETLNLATCANSSTVTKMSPVTCHLSPVTCHMSPITYHLSPVTCHMSPLACHLPPIIFHQWSVLCHLSLSGR